MLDNACLEGAFRDNPEVQGMQLRSVLCLPVIKHLKLVGILYLENRLAERVFTAEMAQMIELLTSQAAISLENARLLEEMKRTEEALRLAKDDLEMRCGKGPRSWPELTFCWKVTLPSAGGGVLKAEGSASIKSWKSCRLILFC